MFEFFLAFLKEDVHFLSDIRSSGAVARVFRLLRFPCLLFCQLWSFAKMSEEVVQCGVVPFIAGVVISTFLCKNMPSGLRWGNMWAMHGCLKSVRSMLVLIKMI